MLKRLHLCGSSIFLSPLRFLNWREEESIRFCHIPDRRLGHLGPFASRGEKETIWHGHVEPRLSCALSFVWSFACKVIIKLPLNIPTRTVPDGTLVPDPMVMPSIMFNTKPPCKNPLAMYCTVRLGKFSCPFWEIFVRQLPSVLNPSHSC